jgi:hypothetical protein
VNLVTPGALRSKLANAADTVRFINRELWPILNQLLKLFNWRTGVIVSTDEDLTLENYHRGVVVDASAGPVTIILNDNPETDPWVLKSDATANAVTIAAPTDFTLTGTSSLSAQYDVLRFDCDLDNSTYYTVGSG